MERVRQEGGEQFLLGVKIEKLKFALFVLKLFSFQFETFSVEPFPPPVGLLQESVGDDEDVRRGRPKPDFGWWHCLISDLELEPPAGKRAARAARAPAEVDLAEAATDPNSGTLEDW